MIQSKVEFYFTTNEGMFISHLLYQHLPLFTKLR